MKAKEYAQKFIDSNGDPTVAVEISRSFLRKIQTLANARNVKLLPGLVCIVKEINKKWMKFAEIVNDHYADTPPVKTNGLMNLLAVASPELHAAYIRDTVTHR